MDAFQNAREEVLAFARKPVAVAVEMAISPKRKMDDTLDGENESPRKRKRSTLRKPQARHPMETIEIQDSDESDRDYVGEYYHPY